MGELEKALNYQEHEVPYILKNDPRVHRTVERWNHPEYLKRLLNDEVHGGEYSANNHFMYWSIPSSIPKNKRNKLRKNGGGLQLGKKFIPEGWIEPTKFIHISYQDWYSHADVDDTKLGPDHPHWYFRLI